MHYFQDIHKMAMSYFIIYSSVNILKLLKIDFYLTTIT